MKKVLIATTIALAAMTASAMDMSVTAARDYSGADRNAVGVTLGQKFGAVDVAVGIDHASRGTNDQTRYSLVGSYNVAKVGDVSLSVKGGAAYLDNQVGNDGYAAVVGVGASYPLTKTMALTGDLTRQYGQNRVNQFDGNRFAVGIKYSF